MKVTIGASISVFSLLFVGIGLVVKGMENI